MSKPKPGNTRAKVPPRPTGKSGAKVPPRPNTTRPGARPVAVNRRPSARTEAMRRRRMRKFLAIGASTVVVVAAVVLIIVKVAGGSSGVSETRIALASDQQSAVTAVPVSTLVAAAQAASSSDVSAPTNLPSTTPPLTSGGHPQILYVGAEYCPFCAAERWSVVMALSKFGTFSGLASTKSSSTDTNPNTPTFSFLNATYSSPYITFTSVEQQNRAKQTLQKLTATENTLVDTYDASPYVSSPGSIPFIDFGGKFIISGAQYDASAISGMSFDKAVTYMTSSANSTSRNAEASAGHLVGVICSLTNDQPSNVCSAVPASLKTGTASSTSSGSSSTSNG